MLTLYSQPDCHKCHMIEKYLNEHNIPHIAVNIREDTAALQTISELGYKMTPVVVEADGSHWGDFRYDRLRALRESA